MSDEILPDGWSRIAWNQRKLAALMADDQRSDDDWELLDRPAVWSDAAAEAGIESELYSLGAAEAIDP